jgi:hypothetical protein
MTSRWVQRSLVLVVGSPPARSLRTLAHDGGPVPTRFGAIVVDISNSGQPGDLPRRIVADARRHLVTSTGRTLCHQPALEHASTSNSPLPMVGRCDDRCPRAPSALSHQPTPTPISTHAAHPGRTASSAKPNVQTRAWAAGFIGGTSALTRVMSSRGLPVVPVGNAQSNQDHEQQDQEFHADQVPLSIQKSRWAEP